MNRILYILIIILLISCTQKKSNKNNLEKAETSTNQSIEIKKENNLFENLNKKDTLGNYQGKIGNNLNVRFYLDNNDGNISGYYFYEKTGIDIRIVGNLKNNHLTAYELGYKNDTIAILKGILNASSIYGKWINYNNKKEYSLTLEKTNIDITPLPTNIEGKYYNDHCNLTLSFSKFKGQYYYTYRSDERTLKGKVNFSRGKELYINLTNIEYAEDYFDVGLTDDQDLEKEKLYKELKKEGVRTVGIECLYNSEELTIQNYGNAMNYYVKLSDCGEKYIHFKKQ